MSNVLRETSTSVRTFTKLELQQIESFKQYMSQAKDVQSWNSLREKAKEIIPEKIISAVDGLHKWIIKYDKPTKTVTYIGVKL